MNKDKPDTWPQEPNYTEIEEILKIAEKTVSLNIKLQRTVWDFAVQAVGLLLRAAPKKPEERTDFLVHGMLAALEPFELTGVELTTYAGHALTLAGLSQSVGLITQIIEEGLPVDSPEGRKLRCGLARLIVTGEPRRSVSLSVRPAFLLVHGEIPNRSLGANGLNANSLEELGLKQLALFRKHGPGQIYEWRCCRI